MGKTSNGVSSLAVACVTQKREAVWLGCQLEVTVVV